MRWTPGLGAAALSLLAGIAGCGKSANPPQSAAIPSRKAGLWEQVLLRDGKPSGLSGMKLCLDAAVDTRLGVFGRHFASGDCKRTVERDATGAYNFNSVCRLGDGSVLTLKGVASGDFNTAYHMRSNIDIMGSPFDPLNGAHQIEITGHYKGPCPSGMRPGDVTLGSGLKVNMDRLPQLAGLVSGG